MAEEFQSASVSRSESRDNIIINDELDAIETAILSAVDTGKLSTVVSNTYMTSPNTTTAKIYYKVWQGYQTDEALNDQMNYIITYFKQKFYTIDRVINTSTNNTFKWVVRW